MTERKTTKETAPAKETAREVPPEATDNPTAAMAREIAASGHPPETTDDLPESAQGRGPEAYAPSSPGQASVAEKDLAAATLAAAPIHPEVALARQREEASANEIETRTRAMAAAGASAGEIALYRAEAFAKLGD